MFWTGSGLKVLNIKSRKWSFLLFFVWRRLRRFLSCREERKTRISFTFDPRQQELDWKPYLVGTAPRTPRRRTSPAGFGSSWSPEGVWCWKFPRQKLRSILQKGKKSGFNRLKVREGVCFYLFEVSFGVFSWFSSSGGMFWFWWSSGEGAARPRSSQLWFLSNREASVCGWGGAAGSRLGQTSGLFGRSASPAAALLLLWFGGLQFEQGDVILVGAFLWRRVFKKIKTG